MKKTKIPPRMLLVLVAAAVFLVCIAGFCIAQWAQRPASPTTPPASQPPAYDNLLQPGSSAPPPASSAPGQIAPPMQGEFIHNDTEDRRYLNNKVLTAPLVGGGVFSLGVDLGQEHFDAIYLSPTTSFSLDGATIGYYISSTPFLPIPQYGPWVNPSQIPGANDFVIETVFDVAKPAAYVDEENYGICWMDDRMMMDAPKQGGEVYIRAVDLGAGKLLGTFRATIDYDAIGDTYAMTSLENTDVINTGYLSAEERYELLSWCYDMLVSGNIAHDMGALNDIQRYGDKETAIANSTVEYTGDRTYFSQVYRFNGKTTSSGGFVTKHKDLVAVNLDCGDTGFFTFYFSPTADPLSEWYMDQESGAIADIGVSLEPLTSRQLNLAGWDIYAPRTANHMTETYF